MTKDEMLQHWRSGVQDALEMATLAEQAGKFDHALFNCHLAVEKALKATHLAKHGTFPRTHDLVTLTQGLELLLSDDQKTQLETLTRFVVDARYSDPSWYEEYATAKMAKIWREQAQTFVSLFLP